ncbi:MAG: serine/threonine-protein kinase [Luteolibacter sp.]
MKNDAPEGLCPRCLAAVNFGTGSLFTAERGSLPPPPVEEIAPHFPQLEILSCLGRGGMGVVYKARQISLDRLVALKLLAPEREKDPEFSERFAREAQALARMSHPHIVTVHDFGQAGGFFYLLMEYVDGANLRQLLQSHRFTPEQALAVVPPLCDALQYAHDRGIVHRDIKPENLLMDRDGKLKVADFGLVKMLGDDPAGDERPVGTPSYMAPEQTADPVNVDNRADIYSLGVVIYEMLTGELPGNNFQPPSSKAAIDGRLDQVVMRAMEQEPDQRYQQASILKTEVEKITQTPPVVPAPEVTAIPKLVRNDVVQPAVAMMVVSALEICLKIFGLLTMILLMVFPASVMGGFSMPFPGPSFAIGMGVNLTFLAIGCWMLVSLGLNAVALIGANRMRKMESHSWSLASAVILIAMGVLSLPGIFTASVSGLIGIGELATGIWGLVVLLRDEVRTEFANPEPAPDIGKSAGPVDPQNAKKKLTIPAYGLMAAATVNLLVLGLVFLALLLRMTHQGGAPMVTWLPLILMPLIAFLSTITFIGAWKMRGLKNHSLAVAGAVLALVTPPGLLIGVVFGIWALVVLFNKEVMAAFPTKNPSGANKGCLVAGLVGATMLLLILAVPAGLLLLRVQRSNSVTTLPGGLQEFHGNSISPMPSFPSMPSIPSPPQMIPDITMPSQPSEAAPSDDFSARLHASRTIRDFTVRDQALAGVAKDAPAAGNVAAANQALQGIVDFTARDDARKEVAMVLCDRGLRKDAVEVAKQMTDFTKRDETLTELATRRAVPVK